MTFNEKKDFVMKKYESGKKEIRLDNSDEIEEMSKLSIEEDFSYAKWQK